ncbi:MAG TPA: Spo0E family sporulation regulatory protein-aspartic acid phosphatase [Clostridia bacterium]|nr:Spo0E family sporulation regulatory protein-aspartic acid phosphatase [Clostridia bacterium]
MTLEELEEELEEKRELLADILRKGDLNLVDGEVLALSRSLDKLIATYLGMVATNASKP